MSSGVRDAGKRSGVAPEFAVDPAILDAISPSGDRGGIVVGSGLHDGPLTISALRSTPTRIVLVGGLYLARQVALRAIAVGAWVVVATGRPAAWQVLSKAAGIQPNGGPSRWFRFGGCRRLSCRDRRRTRRCSW
jgi:hypothetical protein